MNEIEKLIFRTISWFDIFDYPLTSWEIYKWGYKLPIANYQLLINELDKSENLKKLVNHKHGFYFLTWQDNHIKTRKLRYLLAEKKYRKLLRIVKFLALVPFIRVIAAATGLSYSNSKEDDDIDLFIIAKKSKIWLVRFFSTLILKIFRNRPTVRDKKDKICLNFFVDEESLNLKNLMLTEKNNLPDIYFIYWLAWLYPVYQDGKVWHKFTSENSWLKKYLTFYTPQQPIKSRQVTLFWPTKIIKSILEIIFWPAFWNIIFSSLQKTILPPQIKKLANKSTSVIIKNSILKFHDKDRRQEYRTKFYEKTKQIN